GYDDDDALDELAGEIQDAGLYYETWWWDEDNNEVVIDSVGDDASDWVELLEALGYSSRVASKKQTGSRSSRKRGTPDMRAVKTRESTKSPVERKRRPTNALARVARRELNDESW